MRSILKYLFDLREAFRGETKQVLDYNQLSSEEYREKMIEEGLLTEDDATPLIEKEEKLSLREQFRNNPRLVIVNGILLWTAVDILILIIRMILCLVTINGNFIPHFYPWQVLKIIAPLVAYIYATNEDRYSYYKAKRTILHLTVYHAIMLIPLPLFRYYMLNFPSIIVKNIIVDELYTKGMVLELCYGGLFFLALICYGVLGYPIAHWINKYDEDLMKFKLRHKLDEREFRYTSYDQEVARNLETGEPVKVYQNDRYLSTAVDGNSGTGKTSFLLLPMVQNDLIRKYLNGCSSQRALIEFVRQHKGYVHIPDDADLSNFDQSWIIPYEEFKEEYNYICEKWSNSSVVVFAPEPDFPYKTLDMAISLGYNPILIDPLLYSNPDTEKYQKYGKYLKGINPFTYQLGLPLKKEADIIKKKANLFAETLVATSVSDANSKADKFFQDVNTSVASEVAIIEMLWWHYADKDKKPVGRKDCMYPTVDDISICFNSPELVIKHLKEDLEILFGSIDYRDPVTGITSNPAAPEIGEISNCRLKDTPYYSIFLDILKNMSPQIQGTKVLKPEYDRFIHGLRITTQLFLSGPGVKEITSANDCLDWDVSLKRGDVVVIHFAKEMGDGACTGFGLTCQLSLSSSMYARTVMGAEGRSIPLFQYTDELPVLTGGTAGNTGKWVRDYLSLARKYSVSFTVAFQSLAMFSKELSELIQGVGTIYAYGRTNKTEMELLSSLGGMTVEDHTTQSVSYNSILESNPTSSFSERTEEREVSLATGDDIRFTDFTEMVVLRSSNGKTLRAEKARSNIWNAKQEFERLKVIRDKNQVPYQWDRLAERFGDNSYREHLLHDIEKANVEVYIDQQETEEYLSALPVEEQEDRRVAPASSISVISQHENIQVEKKKSADERINQMRRDMEARLRKAMAAPIQLDPADELNPNEFDSNKMVKKDNADEDMNADEGVAYDATSQTTSQAPAEDYYNDMASSYDYYEDDNQSDGYYDSLYNLNINDDVPSQTDKVEAASQQDEHNNSHETNSESEEVASSSEVVNNDTVGEDIVCSDNDGLFDDVFKSERRVSNRQKFLKEQEAKNQEETEG